MIRFLSIFLLCLSFVLPAHTLAQTESVDLSILAIPHDPKPLGTVQLEAKSFGVNLNLVSLTWKYNDKIIASGIGRTRISVTAPAAGVSGTISVSTNGLGFEATSASITLRPGSVDLLWEAVDSYTPPFYKGKALPATNALIRTYAIPTASAPKQLSYQWTRNNSAVPQSSGYGKSTMVFKNSEFTTQERVTVSAEAGQFFGTNTTTIIPRSPVLVTYEREEGFIDYANGYPGTVTTDAPGVVLRFEPYFFSRPRSSMADLTFDYTINGESVPGDAVPNELRLSRPTNGGVSSIKVAVRPIEYIVQFIERTITLAFN